MENKGMEHEWFYEEKWYENTRNHFAFAHDSDCGSHNCDRRKADALCQRKGRYFVCGVILRHTL